MILLTDYGGTPVFLEFSGRRLWGVCFEKNRPAKGRKNEKEKKEEGKMGL